MTDTVTYIPTDFLKEFQKEAGVYIVGEVVTYNFTKHSAYQQDITGLLNFPVAEHLKYIFSPQVLVYNLSLNVIAKIESETCYS